MRDCHYLVEGSTYRCPAPGRHAAAAVPLRPARARCRSPLQRSCGLLTCCGPRRSQLWCRRVITANSASQLREPHWGPTIIAPRASVLSPPAAHLSSVDCAGATLAPCHQHPSLAGGHLGAAAGDDAGRLPARAQCGLLGGRHPPHVGAARRHPPDHLRGGRLQVCVRLPCLNLKP